MKIIFGFLDLCQHVSTCQREGSITRAMFFAYMHALGYSWQYITQKCQIFCEYLWLFAKLILNYA